MRALVYLKLEPGCYPEQYKEQVKALDDIKHLIIKSLPAFRELKRFDKQDLFIQRRVFKKVKPQLLCMLAYTDRI